MTAEPVRDDPARHVDYHVTPRLQNADAGRLIGQGTFGPTGPNMGSMWHRPAEESR